LLYGLGNPFQQHFGRLIASNDDPLFDQLTTAQVLVSRGRYAGGDVVRRRPQLP